jgi:superfamily II DNA or RNA helicase
MIDIIVDSRVRILLSQLGESVANLLREAFTHKNPKRGSMQRAKIRGWWNEPLVIPTWGTKDGYLTLPRGGMAKVRKILQGNLLPFRVRDNRVRGNTSFIPDRSESLPLWPHQIRIIDACLRRENCIVKSSTGSGKTSALLALAARIKVDTLVIVHTTALMHQWVERAVSELGMRKQDVGLIGDGRFKVCELTIGTQKSVANAAKDDPEFLTRWGAVLVDEVHMFAARTFFACVDPFPARYRIGVSDDQRRKDRLECLIHDLFGEVEESITHEEMVEAGHVMDVEVLIIPTEFEAPWYDEARDASSKEIPNYTRLLSEMAEDAERNKLISGILGVELTRGHQCLVFAKEREHCHVLEAEGKRYAGGGRLVGGAGEDRAEFERVRRGLRAGKLKFAVGTIQACGTGVDLPGVEVGIAALPILSNRQMFRQSRGRICRKPEGKTTARFYVLWDRHVFGLSHVENAASWNASTYVLEGKEWVPARQYVKKARMGG